MTNLIASIVLSTCLQTNWHNVPTAGMEVGIVNRVTVATIEWEGITKEVVMKEEYDHTQLRENPVRYYYFTNHYYFTNQLYTVTNWGFITSTNQ